jgi:rRNA pseudouridine-1189 N-methylase Emg1 (Nep1/Mra1 family)
MIKLTERSFKRDILAPLDQLRMMIIELNDDRPALEAIYEKLTDHLESLETALRTHEKGGAFVIRPVEQENDLTSENMAFIDQESKAAARALNKKFKNN